MGVQSIERKDAVGSLGTAFRWLLSRPELLVVFGLAAVAEEPPDILWSQPHRLPATTVRPEAGVEPQAITFLVGLLGFLVPIFATAVGHSCAGDLALERRPSLGDAVSTAATRLPALVAVTIFYAVSVLIGLLFLIVPGIYVALRLVLAFPAVVNDGNGVLESLETSWEVTRENLPKIIGIYCGAVIAAGLFVLLAGLLVLLVKVLAVPSETSQAVSLLADLDVIVFLALVRALTDIAFGRVYVENTDRTTPTARRFSDIGLDTVSQNGQRGSD